MAGKYKSRQQMLEENHELRARLDEAEARLRASEGDVQVYAMHGAEQLYRVMIEAMQDGAAALAPDGLILYCNRHLAEMLRSPLEQVSGASLRQFVAPADWGKINRLLLSSVTEQSYSDITLHASDGTTVPVQLALGTVPLNDTSAIVMVATDLTERKRAETRLRKLNRVYAVLSDINQAIVRLREPQALFDQVCQIAVQVGGFRMAWIGLLDESLQMQVVAHAGGADTYFEQAGVTLRDALVDDCPIQNALRGGQRAICNMIRCAASCQEIAFQLGSRSSAAFPLLVSGKIRGAVNFYSGEPDFFDEEEIKLLDELALDLSFAMEFAEQESERKRTEEAIQSLARFPSENPNPILRIGRDGILLYANEASDALLRGWQLDVGQPAPSVLRQVVSDTLTRQMGITIDTQHDQRIISFFVAPVVEAGYSNLYGRDVTERRRAEEALRENEDKFKYVFDYSIVGKSITLPTGEVHVNKAFCEMLGYSAEELQSKRWQDISHPDDNEVTQREIDSLLSGEKEAARFLKRYLQKNGSVVWADVSTSLRRDKQGKPLYLMTTVVDITERKRSEQVLQQSEEKYRALFENAQVGMYRTKIDGSAILDVNQNLLDIFGYTREEMIASPSTMRWAYPEEREKMARRLRADGVVTNLEVAFITKMGELRDFLISVKVYPEQGVLEGTGLDITDRKRAEDALHDSEERYRTTLYSIGDSVITTDTEGRVWQMNPAAEKITGWREAEAMEKPISDVFCIVNEDTRREVENPVARVLREGVVVGLANHTLLIARDGAEYPVADSGAPIRNLQGEITGVVLVFRDQTAERAAEKTLRESERKFRETVTNLDEGYYSCMLDGVLLDHNRAFNRMLGFEVSQDLRGTKLPDFWQNPEDRKGYVSELMTRGVVSNYLINAKTIGGEKIVVMANAHLVKDENGKPVRIEGSFTDITERKRAEQAIESLARFPSENPNPVLRIQQDGILLYANEASATLLRGWQLEIGKPAPSVLQEVISDAWTRRIGITIDTQHDQRIISFFVAPVVETDYANLYGRDVTDRRRAEEALRESEVKLRAILDATPFPIALVDVQDNNIDFWSRSALALFGHTAPTATEWYQIAYPDPDYRREVIDRWKPFLEMAQQSAQAVNTGVYRVACRDGSVRICELYAAFLADSLIVTFNDITERKRAEEALRESEEKHRRLFETMAQGVVYQAANGGIISANPAAERILGLTLDQMQEKTSLAPDWKAIREDGSELPGQEHPAMVALRTGKAVEHFIMGVMNPQKNAHTWLSVTAIPLFQPGETTPFQVHATFDDITAERRAEENYRTLFHEMLDGFALHEIICDEAGNPADYRFLAVNPAFERMTGLKAQDIVGRTVLQVLPGTEPHWIETYGKVALTGEPAFFENYSGDVKKHFEVTAFRPAPNQFACIFADITERRQAEVRIRKLNRAYAMLSEVNQAIVRLREPQALFDQVCRIAVQVGGFRMAWIGFVDESSQVQVVAHAGGADTYFEQAGVTLRDALVDDCPIQNALLGGQRVICNVIGRDALCQKIAFQLGCRSSAAFPLLVSGKIRGAVNFYSGEPDFFDEEEIKLLDELALDLSFAIEFAEKEAEHQRAEKAIESLARFPSENPNPVLRIQRDGILLYANEASDALLRGWQLDVGQPAPPVLQAAVSDTLTRQIGITIDTQHDQRIISFFVAPVVEAGYSNLYGRDVTERRRADEAVKSAKAFLDTVVDMSPFAMWISDKEGTLMRANHSLRDTINLTDDKIVGKYNVLKDINLEIQGVMPMVRAVFEKHEPTRFSIPWKAADAGDVDFKGGRDMYIDVSMFPILNAQGELTNVVCQWVDITERKRAEAQLAEQLDELRRWHKATLGRETRLLDLKREVNELLAQAGQPPRYPSAE